MDGLSLSFLEPEWERLELLGHFLFRNRRAREVSGVAHDKLRLLQEEVGKAREPGGGWDRVVTERLSRMEFDLLACVVAPVVAPRIGWMYRNLQGDISRSFPSPELIKELFALDADGAHGLQRALSEDATLRTAGLIKFHESSSSCPIEPEPWVAEKLLGLELMEKPPPGAKRVRVLGNWDSLEVSGNLQNMLLEFLIWIRHSDVAEQQWNGMPSGGPVAHFSGPWATGKTLAAGFLANELGRPLFRVEPGLLVGECFDDTRGNIDALFDDAKDRPMVLLFHDSNGFFSKPGKEKASVNSPRKMAKYLLRTRIEEHRGPCIVSTDTLKYGDSVLTGRVHMDVEFPLPEDSNAFA